MYLVELDGLCAVAEAGCQLPDEGGLAAAPGPHQAQVHHSVGHHQLAQQARVVRRTHVLCTTAVNSLHHRKEQLARVVRRTHVLCTTAVNSFRIIGKKSWLGEGGD